MENKKCYIVVDEWQFDSGECGSEIRVFKNHMNALKYYEDICNDARIDFLQCFDDETIQEDYDKKELNRSFSIYEKGEYCYNHINIKLEVKVYEEDTVK